MRTVTIGVSSLEEAMDRFERAASGEPQGEYFSFATMGLLWKTITPRRLEILRAMAGQPPLSLRAVSRLVNRDVKTTHGDVHVLLDGGILQQKNGKIVFPYDTVHVDFMIRAAA